MSVRMQLLQETLWAGLSMLNIVSHSGTALADYCGSMLFCPQATSLSVVVVTSERSRAMSVHSDWTDYTPESIAGLHNTSRDSVTDDSSG